MKSERISFVFVILVAVMALGLVLTSVSCKSEKGGEGKEGKDSPKKGASADNKAEVTKAIEAYIKAIKAGDVDGMYATIMNEEVKMMKENKKGIDEGDKSAEYEILSVTMDGEVGIVEISIKAENMTGKSKFYLLKEDGQYKVSFLEQQRRFEEARKAAKKGK
ncbi:MAG: nuclear transport factor 2 family protein [Planctomycetota bacterium]